MELIGCNEITEAGLWACLTPRIVSLTLSDCINVADDAVGAVAQMLPALNEFTLQAYHVTDAALGFFSSRQSNSLSTLRLQSCWELTNHGIVNIGELYHMYLYIYTHIYIIFTTVNEYYKLSYIMVVYYYKSCIVNYFFSAQCKQWCDCNYLT